MEVGQEGDKSVLRWGGLAGFVGGILFIIVFIVVGVFVGVDPDEPREMVERFPDIRPVRVVENGLYLSVLILWVVHLLALYRALRSVSLAPALFGSFLGIVGLVVLAAGALPHIATLPISDLYHSSNATATDQATLVLLWQATQGIFDALLFTGLFILPIGVIALGVAMLGAPAFGKGLGRLSVILGAIGFAAAVALLIDPLLSSLAAAGIFALIVFHVVLGSKLYRLSKT